MNIVALFGLGFPFFALGFGVGVLLARFLIVRRPEQVGLRRADVPPERLQ